MMDTLKFTWGAQVFVSVVPFQEAAKNTDWTLYRKSLIVNKYF